MKGIVFTEFMEMVASTFSEDMADDIIDACDLPSGGAYTAVGAYDHGEMVKLVTALSAKTGVEGAALQEAFGRYLFGRFATLYGDFFKGMDDALDFLSRIEDHIHVEVRKLYPDAELPTLQTALQTPNTLHLIYLSSRPFGPLCHGLILACCDHFGGGYEVEMNDRSTEGSSVVKFIITRRQAA